MSEEIRSITILIAALWPLLLALPAVHSRLPWPRHLALVPALMLVLWPGDYSLAIPWSLFGTGFLVDGNVRWLLVMSMAVWLTAAIVGESSRRTSTYNSETILFLLTLSGNLGVVLASDLIGFFSFSTLMGYGFYGLLVQDGDEEVRRAGRIYLFFLIVADLALFEALLLAANMTEDLQYQTVRQAMMGTSSTQFYLGIVFFGFAVKAGIWPFHLWLIAAFNTRRRITTLLLAGLPVAMGLLGAVRWIPLGVHAFNFLGMILQILGVAATLYAVLRFLIHASLKVLPAWSTVAGAGLFVVPLGRGLIHPDLWREYEYLAYPLIALMGIFLTALTFTIGRWQDTHQHPTFSLQRVEALIQFVGGRVRVTQQWIKNQSLGLQAFWHALGLKATEPLQRTLDWEKTGIFAGGWSATITFFVLLGLMMSWLSY